MSNNAPSAAAASTWPGRPKELRRGAAIALAICLGVIAGSATGAGAHEWELRVCADPNNLPYSNERGEGFENRIAELIADELDAELVYVWHPHRRGLIGNIFREGECELVLGVTDGHPQLLTTIPYYRSSYMFVYRADSAFEIESLDDPALRDLKIGIQMVGGATNATPPGQALANRGLGENLVGISVYGDYSQPHPLSGIVEAVAGGDVDVALVWGPVAGYFAARQSVELELVKVEPEIEPPFIPMVFAISIGMRPGDEDLRDLLHRAMASRWDEIQNVLGAYHVPLSPLQSPGPALHEP
jgi:mxaJ protein